jgi:hypothetical protein
VTSWERVAFAVAASLALAALAFGPLSRALDPTLAAAITFPPTAYVFVERRVDLTRERSWPISLVDPWGRPCRAGALTDITGNPTIDPCFVYSVGPDGQDAFGAGDDITSWAVDAHPIVRAVPGVVLRSPRVVLALLAAIVALSTLVARRTLRAPRASVTREAARAAWIVAFPCLAIAPWLAFPVAALDAPAPAYLVVSPRTALALTWALLLFLPAFAWRLSREREDPRETVG